jgi:CRP-like cAMP-binding protein
MHLTALPAGIGEHSSSVSSIGRCVLARLGDVVAVAEDETICLEGTPAEYGYRVLSGLVRLSKLTADGRRCVLEFLLAGDLFGVEAGDIYTSTAEAAGPVLVARFLRSRAEAAAQHCPETARALRDAIAERLVHAHEKLLRLACLSATERTASCLLEMAERFGEEHEVTLPMRRADLADHLGLRPETLCRVLAGLRRRGAIAQPAANRIVVRSRILLEDAAMQGRRIAGLFGDTPEVHPVR